MKTIFVLTTLAFVMGEPRLLLAQKATEPVATEPALPGAGSGNNGLSTSARSTRNKVATPATIAPFTGGGLGGSYTVTSSRGDSIPPVMIRFSQPDAKTSTTLEEDLFVMARVIGRTLERAETDKVNYKLGVPMLLTGSGRSVRPMYLEGLGPLFMIKVNFPVMPPPKPEEKAVPAAPEDSEWTEAQKDLYGNPETDRLDETAGRPSGYNEEQVELLKKELIGALKNAANIRGLRPDEFVNIAVFGHATATRTRSTTFYPNTPQSFGATAQSYEATESTSGGKGSVLTLRVRRSDIDGFARGQLTDAAFKAKVTMTTYAGSGIGITSINSWIQESVGRLRP